ncbi:MAG: zinc-ribbon domain-containing protein [bacterium]
MAVKECPRCGVELNDPVNVCTKCGKKLDTNRNEHPNTTKLEGCFSLVLFVLVPPTLLFSLGLFM